MTLVAQAMHIFNVKDKNLVFASMLYYRVIHDIWGLDYTIFRVPIFQCNWVGNNHGMKVDELGFILIDLNRVGHNEDTFILASQAKQFFYITNDDNDENNISDNIDEVPSFLLD